MKDALSRKAEDYLETILNMIEAKGYARIKDIAPSLGVKPPSVVEMMRKLDEMGYIIYRRYDGVTLTSKGEDIAKGVKDRHNSIKAFLGLIKVPEGVAAKDACIIEHELGAKTIEQIKKFVKFVKSDPEHSKWFEHFEVFCETEKRPCEDK